MQRLQAFLYELQPNGEQQRRMRRSAGCRRFFNQALRLEEQRHEAGEKTLGYAGVLQAPVRARTERSWIKTGSSSGAVGLQAAREGCVIAVPSQNTSRTCVGCGHVSVGNRRTQEPVCMPGKPGWRRTAMWWARSMF